MITAEIKINERPIITVSAVNRGKVDGEEYEYEYSIRYEEDSHVKRGILYHRRPDGATNLIKSILELEED